MTIGFVFQPHLHNGDGTVITPDIAIESLTVLDCGAPQARRYPIPIDRLTTAPEVQQIDGSAHGSAGVFLVAAQFGILFGVGSDHIDQRAAAPDVARQLCSKPIGRQVWRLSDVADHWQKLSIRSWAGSEANQVQSCELGEVIDPREMPREVDGRDELARGRALLVSGFPMITRPHSATQFKVEIKDPVHDRQLVHAYTIELLATGTPE